MSGKFKLRPGSASDFDELHEIYMDKGVNRFLSFEVMGKRPFKDVFGWLMRTGRLYVYEHEGRIKATCVVIRHLRRARHVATLGTFATHPRFQGQGIGTRFMQALIARIRKEGVRRVQLWVEADNPAAIGLYEKLGFKTEGILKKYFKRKDESRYVDNRIMALILN